MAKMSIGGYYSALGILLAGGDGGACTSRIWLLKDMDYLRSSSSISEGMCTYSIEREAFLCSGFLSSVFLLK